MTITTDTLRVAIYARISDDKRGDSAGVERQLDDAQALAAIRGWSVIGQYTDNDISASSGAHRASYARLMADAASGAFDQIICWQTSRLWRNRQERARGIDMLRQARVGIVTVKGTDLDLSTAGGRAMAGMQGEFDTWESEVKSERVLRALEQNAQNGRPHGRRAYGWQRVYDPETGRSHDEVEPEEAAVVREIAQRIVSGDSLRSITADLNERGVPSPSSKPGESGPSWGPQMVRHLVQRERNVGLRVHRGEVIGEGTWDPILARGLWEQARAVLRDPARRTSTGSAAAHLLSGIARCGVCGGPIRAGMNRQIPSYRCASNSCVSRNRADVDAYVEATVLSRLAMPDAAQLFTPEQNEDQKDASAEAAEYRSRLDTAADQFADGKIDAIQFERVTARLRPRLAAAESRIKMVDPTPLLEGLAGVPNVEAAWNSMALTRRRAIVDLLVTITIHRTRQGARVFEPDSVAISWR